MRVRSFLLSRLTLSLALATLIGGCGGGGGGTDSTVAVVDPLAPASASDLDKAAAFYGIEGAGVGGDSAGDGGAAGAAGDGAPLQRAVVTLTDAKGNQVSGFTDSNGKFLLKYQTKNFTAPLVLRVIDAGGNVLTSVTDESASTGKAIRASINPLTDKITSDVLAANVPGTDKSFDGSGVTIARLAKAKADMVSSINAALGTAGVADVSKFDPVKSVYSYDGTGVDAIIESISHARDPGTGATQLRAKLVGVTDNADGTAAATLITPSTPLATSSVALASNPALTFTKINAWLAEVNRCAALSIAVRNADAACNDNDGTRIVSQQFKHNSRDLAAYMSTLFSDTGRNVVQGSTLSNPNVLFIGRYAGSTIDDLAVVEVTIRMPGTGPLAGSLTTPIEFTNFLVFRRDDSLKSAVAGNWILYGNQRSFDWSIEPNYFASVESNPARQANSTGGSPSAMRSGIRLNVAGQVFDNTTKTFKTANIYAVRFKGPGLPPAGVVMAPTSTGGNPGYRILNKTGVIPAEGTLSTNVQTDFRMGGVTLGTGLPLDPAVWAARVYQADAPTGTDFTKLQAFNLYTAEIYLAGSTTPIVESSRILAPIQSPATMAKTLLHDLSPSLAAVTPPLAASSQVNVQWTRVAGATRIESAYALFNVNGINSAPSASVADAFFLAPSSTSVAISNGTTGFPAATVNDYREVGISGRAARSFFLQSLARTP